MERKVEAGGMRPESGGEPVLLGGDGEPAEMRVRRGGLALRQWGRSEPQRVISVNDEGEAGGEEEGSGGGDAEGQRGDRGESGDDGGKRKRFHGECSG